jgi:hypothetical protein
VGPLPRERLNGEGPACWPALLRSSAKENLWISVADIAVGPVQPQWTKPAHPRRGHGPTHKLFQDAALWLVPGCRVNGRTSLVIGCHGSPLGGGPPDLWRVPGPGVGVAGGLAGRLGFRPARGLYTAVASSAGLPLSRMICAVSLGVYLLRTTVPRQRSTWS